MEQFAQILLDDFSLEIDNLSHAVVKTVDVRQDSLIHSAVDGHLKRLYSRLQGVDCANQNPQIRR